MTDRELLEAAAKAAGIVGEYDDIAGEAGIIVMRGFGSRVWTGKVWNPLTSDADALRLAVKLRLNLSLVTSDADALRLAVNLRLNLSLDRTGIKVFHDDKPCIKAGGWESRADENEVVRRAIVRAAAEIGRQA